MKTYPNNAAVFDNACIVLSNLAESTAADDCDECEDDQPTSAVACCEICGKCLCTKHVHTHSKLKFSRDHVVVPLAGAKRARVTKMAPAMCEANVDNQIAIAAAGGIAVRIAALRHYLSDSFLCLPLTSPKTNPQL